MDLFFLKLSVVVAVFYSGISLHQLTVSYSYTRDKVREFKKIADPDAARAGLDLLGMFFYGLLPLLFLMCLAQARLFPPGLLLFAAKLAVSAALGFYMQKRVLRDAEYSRHLHLAGRIDSAANFLAGAILILRLVTQE